MCLYTTEIHGEQTNVASDAATVAQQPSEAGNNTTWQEPPMKLLQADDIIPEEGETEDSPQARIALHKLQAVLQNMGNFSRALKELEEVLEHITQEVNATIESIADSSKASPQPGSAAFYDIKYFDRKKLSVKNVVVTLKKRIAFELKKKKRKKKYV